MKLKLNKEYAHRHLFVTLLMAGLCCWFGYDGCIRYPAMSAANLYKSIEKQDPPAGANLVTFKAEKIRRQYEFAGIALLVSLVVGLRLLKSARFDFEFDDDGFTCRGRRFARADIDRIDRSQWEKKSILTLRMTDGTKIVLDGWHHTGVREFAAAYPG